jgi:chromatin remodeling complex protein RSC6
MKGSDIMPKKGSHLNKIKIKPTGPLADMIGSKARSRPEIVKALWKHIDKQGLKGEKGDGHSVTYNGRKYVGGQVIHCGECPMMKKFCGGKSKVAMVQLAKFTEKHSVSA